jgi:hypothetical protein
MRQRRREFCWARPRTGVRNKLVALTNSKELNVVLNWLEELKRRAPPGKK